MKVAFKVCLLFVLLALVGPGNALALTSQQAVEKIRAAFDEKTIRQGLDEVRYFKKAGFIYQPALSVPRSGTCPIEEIWDQKAVMSGMVACDRTNAFFYGTYEDLRQETEILRKLMPQVAPWGVTPEEQKTLQKEMDTEKGRAMLARRIGHVLDELLSHAGRSEKDLRFLCAHLYGDQIERFYTACVMVLAAAESGTLTPLYHVRVDWGRKMADLLLEFSAAGLVGDRAKSLERHAKLKELYRLCSANNYSPPLANLRKIFKICQEERNHYIVPCQ